MSVNYHWIMQASKLTIKNPIGDEKTIEIDENDPVIHVCQWAAGRYSWAQDPHNVLAYCDQNPTLLVIRDENGITYTGKAFAEMVRGQRWETDLIGQWFC